MAAARLSVRFTANALQQRGSVRGQTFLRQTTILPSLAISFATQQHFFSDRAAAAAAPAPEPVLVPVPAPLLFRSPRVEELYHKMTTLEKPEINTIVDLMGQKLGMDIILGEMAGGGAGSSQDDAAPVEEEVKKTAFDLKLTGFDAKSKIKVIKEVRAMAGLGLKEAKELVEGAPKVVMKGIKMEEAEKLKTKLEALGATIEIS